MKTSKKVLITTNRPGAGGVGTMLRFVIDCLKEKNFVVTLAYYEPYSVSPAISVPFFRLPVSKPSMIQDVFYGCRSVGLGCWLPEFESSHYRPSAQWMKLVAEHDLHLMVSGSCLAARVYLHAQIPFLGWVASDWQGDRDHRVQQYSWLRKLVDDFAMPAVKRLERNIVRSGNLIALSRYTANKLNRLAGGEPVTEVLAMPVDTNRFVVDDSARIPYRIGFVGRFEDPRKNLGLLLRSIALIARKIPSVELLLVGDCLSASSEQLVDSLGLRQNLTVVDYVENDNLHALLQTLDIFALPSFQEGLCIAAMEAMSCGVPVVSTRCGGPESFIVSGENGLFCDFSATDMSDAILQLLTDASLRKRYATAAREVIIRQFSHNARKQQFWSLLERKFETGLSTLK